MKSPEEVLAVFEQSARAAGNRPYQLDPGSCSQSYTLEEAETFLPEPGVIYEEKFDGLRYLFQVRPADKLSRQNYLTSRRVSKVTGQFVEKQDKVPMMRDWRAPMSLWDSIFDGEIFSSGLSSDTQHDLVTGNVVYKCWDVLRLGGKWLVHLPRAQRRQHLVRALKGCPSWFELVSEHRSPQVLLASIRATKGEGMIRKLQSAPYGEGWAKIKGEKFYDVVVTGYELSKEGKYAQRGWIKGIKFGQFVGATLTKFGQTSGITESLRQEISERPKKFLGRPFEIACQLRLASGKFRHPRFSRWRDDKNPEDCVFKKEEA